MRVLSLVLTLSLLLIPTLQAAQKYPAVGTVNVRTTLNVRSAGSVDSDVLGQLKKGDQVIIIAEEGEFYKLQYPKQLQAWVASWLLLENGKGKKDKVSQDKVNIRSGPTMQYPIIARLAKGFELEIKSVNTNKWAQINPPSNAVAYASKKYITIGESYISHLAKKKKQQQTVEKMAQLENQYKKMVARQKISQQEYANMEKSLQKIIKDSNGSSESIRARDLMIQLANFRNIVAIAEVKQKTEDDLRRQKDHLKKKHDAEMKKITAKKKVKKPTYQYEGWLDDLGGIWRKPATHKLKKGNKILYYLKSDKGLDLDEFVGKRVGINGKLKSLPLWGRMIIVEKIEVLYEHTDTTSKIWTKD